MERAGVAAARRPSGCVAARASLARCAFLLSYTLQHMPAILPDDRHAPTARRAHWTPAKQRIFLVALHDTGCVAAAAQAAGMSRSSARMGPRRRAGTPFVRTWDSVLASYRRRCADPFAAPSIDVAPRGRPVHPPGEADGAIRPARARGRRVAGASMTHERRVRDTVRRLTAASPPRAGRASGARPSPRRRAASRRRRLALPSRRLARRTAPPPRHPQHSPAPPRTGRAPAKYKPWGSSPPPRRLACRATDTQATGSMTQGYEALTEKEKATLRLLLDGRENAKSMARRSTCRSTPSTSGCATPVAASCRCRAAARPPACCASTRPRARKHGGQRVRGCARSRRRASVP
ncbi:hypothetical protein AB5I41_20690 [Sphingomonas sp. MMS24-JH45]